jgi:hypothetical protein
VVSRDAYAKALRDGTTEAIKALVGAVDKVWRSASLGLHPDRVGYCPEKKAKYEHISKAKSVLNADLAGKLEVIEKGEQLKNRGAKRRIVPELVGTD